MLTNFEKARIKDLAARNLSHRAIAKQTGHSRQSIGRVLSHTGPNARRLTAKTTSIRRRKARQQNFRVDYVRCAGCGRRVNLPCLTCRIERLRMLNQFLKAA